MATSPTEDSGPIAVLTEAVQRLDTRNIDAKNEMSEILHIVNKKAENINADQRKKVLSVIQDVGSTVPLLDSDNKVDKIIGIVQIGSFILPCLIPALGPLQPIAALARPILRLLSKFLTYIVRGKVDITVLLKEDLDLKDLEHEIVGVEKEFQTSLNYLCGVDDHKQITKDDVRSMISCIDLDKGLKILGSLQSKTKIAVLQRDVVQVNKAIHYVAYYARIASLRNMMLGKMSAIISVAMEDSATANAIQKVLEGESEEDVKFLKFLTKPTLETAMFFALFNVSKFEDIEIFLKKKDLEFQNLNKDLNEKMVYIQPFSSVSGSSPFVEIANSYWGTVCAAKQTNPADAPQFHFQAISEKDNYFHIKMRDKYMYMKSNRYCVGTHNNLGEEGHWKVIKIDKDCFILSPKLGPGNFLYMERKFGMIGFRKLKGLSLEREISERVLWKITEKKKPNLDKFKERLMLCIEIVKTLTETPTEKLL